MAVSVAQSWSGSYAPPLTLAAGAVPAPGNLGLAVPVAMPAGDWAVAVVTWRQPPNSPAVTIASVADDAHSWWEPLGAPQAASDAQGVTRTVIWYAPRSRASAVVQCSPTGFVLSLAMVVLDVTGMSDWIALAPVATGWANASTALSMSSIPGASAFMVAAAGSDLLTATISGPGAGWTAVTPVTASNGTDHTSDLQLNAAWQATSSEADANWASTAGVDFSGVIGGLLAAPAALAQPNPNWAAVIPEAAIGAGQYSTADQMGWVPLTAPVLDFSFTQGRQYERNELATGDGALSLDNPTGQLLPPAFPQSAGIDSGTPARLRMYWPGGPVQVQFHGDGVTAGPFLTGFSTFAAPGTLYSQTAWASCSPAWPAGMTLALNFTDAGFHTLATFTSAPAAGPSPAPLAVSGIAPPGTVFYSFQLVVAGTPPAATVFSASAAVPAPGAQTAVSAWSNTFSSATIISQSAWAPDVRGPWNVTPWYAWSVLIERLPQAWDEVWRGFTGATITDCWASLTQYMQAILTAELLGDSPQSLWPLTDLATSVTGSNLAPGNPNPMFVTLSKYGASGATQAFGQNSGAIPGAAGTFLINPQFRVSSQAGMWGQTLPNAIFADGFGYSLQAVDANFPPVAGGVTIEFWFSVAAPIQTSGNAQALVSAFTLGNLQWYIAVQPPPSIGGNGNLILYTAGPAGGLHQATISAVNYQVTTIAATHVALTFNTTTWTAYVNGVQTASGSWTSPLSPSFSLLSLNGSSVANRNVSLGAISGFTGWCAVFPRILHPLRILTHYQAGITGMAGDPASYRIERILLASTASLRRMIGYETSFTTGGSGPDAVVSCSDLPGSPAGQGISNIANATPPGMLLVTPGGELFMLTKEKAFGQAYKWVLGENTAAGEIPYLEDAGLGYDPQRVVNNVQLTQLDSENVVTSQVPAITQASQHQYSQVVVNNTGFLQGDATVALNAGPGLYDQANWYATTTSRPLTRGEIITVDAASNPAAWPFVLGASVGDPVLLNRRPLGLAPPGVISIPGRISQTKRRLVSGHEDHTEASIQVIIDAMPEVNILTLDDPVKGQLNGVNILGW